MKEVKKKSVIPIYAFAAVWIAYCAFFPLYKTYHYIALVSSAALAYIAASLLFPGKSEFVELPQEPARTGVEGVDALLSAGEEAVAELRALGASIPDAAVRGKLDSVITVTDKIFKNLIDAPAGEKQVKRFAEYYLPTTTKLMRAYVKFLGADTGGENVTSSLERISSSLDMILESYRKFLDSLFMDQALDIETDIRVLESFLKKEGLSGNDFTN
ncbi:MAG: 5-bromo-4-chloroindolyl phosphate hydrolysis family protein [Oscillospiraceae bacterium]|jgi:hypothetical protein|nr:5-bromo-4-chloroindolyl phosphate hydrolysis family protein [Oscillospiraceae bacterium]